MTAVLKELEREIELEGYKRGTFPFDAELRKRKVVMCKSARSLNSCWDCAYLDHCELIKQHLRDLRFNTKATEPEVKDDGD